MKGDYTVSSRENFRARLERKLEEDAGRIALTILFPLLGGSLHGVRGLMIGLAVSILYVFA